MIEPLGLGLLSTVWGTFSGGWVGSSWGRELVEPGGALCAGFLSVALLALELILPFA